jgi:hypothetical protein
LRLPAFGLQVSGTLDLEFCMTRLRQGVCALVACLGLAAFVAAPADAKVRHRHPLGVRPAASRPVAFPNYVDRGSDRNPGGDDLYFSDTKYPHYIVGPAWFQRWEDQ